jgi:hypothetical protein
MKRRPLASVLSAGLLALGCSGSETPRTPPAAPGSTVAFVDGVAASARVDPMADERLRAHQGGPLCDRTDRRDLRPFRDSVPVLAREDLSVGPEFLCRLRADGPALRLKVASDGEPGGWVDSVLVYVPAAASRPREVLRPEEGSAPYLGADFLRGVDLNHDGWTDVQVARFSGATGNQIDDVFMFDPARGRFVRDAVLSGHSRLAPVEGRQCVTTHWGWGHAGALSDRAEHCWIRGRWTEQSSESQADPPSLGTPDRRVYLRTTRSRRADGSYTERVDTVRA